MCAWLLHISRASKESDAQTPMGVYVDSLPREADMTVLLNYKPMEQIELQIHRCAPPIPASAPVYTLCRPKLRRAGDAQSSIANLQ